MRDGLLIFAAALAIMGAVIWFNRSTIAIRRLAARNAEGTRENRRDGEGKLGW